MAKHSTLTNPDDLHYAKVRIFSGDPASITPDFVGEILVDDQQKIYLANGVEQGNLIELAPQGVGEGGGSSALVEIGQAYPQSLPSGIGNLYFDLNSFRMFVSSELSPFAWLPIDSKPTLTLSFDDSGLDPSTNILISHAKASSIRFDNLFDSVLFEGSFSALSTSEIAKKIRAKGSGIYKFVVNQAGGDSPFYVEIEEIFSEGCNIVYGNLNGEAKLAIPNFAITTPDATAQFTLFLRPY